MAPKFTVTFLEGWLYFAISVRIFTCCLFLFVQFSFSLTVKEQFEGSEANLRRFFDQKSSKFSRLLATESQDENGDQLISSGNSDPTELAILHLLILSKELLFEESTKQLPQVSKKVLPRFHFDTL
jgi:hypothetical protein